MFLNWRRKWHPTPVLLPGKSHGWRSLVGCSPWGRWESDTTERLHFHFSLSCTREGNGNPLQCSCQENPRDGWAWWAAVYGVAQSWTRLKRLSSSSSMLLNIGDQDKWNLSLPYSIFPASGAVFVVVVLVTKSSLTLCDPMDCGMPGSSVHGISQAKVLEWVAISFSRGSCYPGIEPWSLTSSVLAGGFFITESPEKPQWCCVLRTKFCLVLCFNTVYPGCSLLPSLTTLKTTGSQGNVQG